MQARLKNPAMLIPEAMPALQALAKIPRHIPDKTFGLVHLRVSQINGCAVCIDGHKHDDTPQRLMAVAAWRDAPFFTDAERAALALAEVATRLADRSDPVPDDIWAEAAKHFDEPGLASLVLVIAMTNLWNRLNVTTRQVAGARW
jgi:AhpD family alkylhydroperoxidase